MTTKRNRWPGVFRRPGSPTWSFRAQFHDNGSRWGVSGEGYDTAHQAWEARQKAIAEAKPLRHLEARPDTTVTLAEYLTAWVTDHVRTVRPATESAYLWRVEQITKLPGARKRLRAMTEGDFRRLIADLREQSPSHATLMAKVGVLQTALNAAVRAGILAENPASKVRISRTQPKFQAKSWDAATALKFLAHREAAHDPLYPVWRLALVTGMRRGELHGLKWGDFDLDAGVVHVRRQRTEVRGRIIEQAPKTEGSEAPVYLDPDTVALLRAVRVSVEDGYGPEEYFVLDRRIGRPYRSMELFRRDWINAQKAAGVPIIRFHDTRHTTASLLAYSGVPLSAAQARLRHWSPAMTAHYTHVQDSAAQEVAARIGAVLRSEAS
jgi:integrase